MLTPVSPQLGEASESVLQFQPTPFLDHSGSARSAHGSRRLHQQSEPVLQVIACLCSQRRAQNRPRPTLRKCCAPGANSLAALTILVWRTRRGDLVAVGGGGRQEQVATDRLTSGMAAGSSRFDAVPQNEPSSRYQRRFGPALG